MAPLKKKLKKILWNKINWPLLNKVSYKVGSIVDHQYSNMLASVYHYMLRSWGTQDILFMWIIFIQIYPSEVNTDKWKRNKLHFSLASLHLFLGNETAIYLAWSERFNLSTLKNCLSNMQDRIKSFSVAQVKMVAHEKKWLGKSHNSLDLIHAFSGDNHHSWYEEGSAFGPLYTLFYRLLYTQASRSNKVNNF